MTWKSISSVLAAVAAAGVVLSAADVAGTVTGRIAATGLRTSAGVVVSLERPGLTVSPPAEPIEVDQAAMQFVPHVVAVVKGTTVRFRNSDPVPHNVFAPTAPYLLNTAPAEVADHTFDKPGVYAQLCTLHPEMEAYVVVLESPYFAVTDPAGDFEIADVPPGEYTLVAWSERLKETKQSISVEAGKQVTVTLALKK